MKKSGMFVFSLLFLIVSVSPVLAGGADNKTNWSAEYIGILNRNAATDAADITMYNPAGVMEMEDGLYANMSAHFIAKDYNNKIGGRDFDQDEPSLVPGLFTVYKTDRWAAYFAASNIIGGGEVDYTKGNATTNFAGSQIISGVNAMLAASSVPSMFYYTNISSQSLKAEHTGLAYTIGGAYKINDAWSVSLGARYLKSEREMTGAMTISPTTPFPTPGVNDPMTARVGFEEEADGLGGIIGLNFAPTPELNIGLHFDTKINLDYDQTVLEDTMGILPRLGVVNNGTRNRDLPAALAGGISYMVTPQLRVEGDVTMYLNKDAGFSDIAGTTRDESAVDNGFDIGLGFEYACTDSVKATFGYLYTYTGVDPQNMTPELPELDSHTLGAGIRYQLNERLNFTFSLGQVFYEDATFVNAGIPIVYEKDIIFVGFGMEYKFL